jgi:hypothetical protein
MRSSVYREAIQNNRLHCHYITSSMPKASARTNQHLDTVTRKHAWYVAIS